MQRLVYSPGVTAMVRTDTGIIDISDYIVSGQVSRVLNEVSTAELTIRNPEKQFTKPGDPTFRPMDGITIFAQRYKSRPVQIFTGYLDQTPYLQLYPGTCTFTASCTLKRLLYTYVDFGIPFTLTWLRKYGWLPNPATGTITSPKGQSQGSGIQPGGGGNQRQEVQSAIITDGSIGNLLFNALADIGAWNKDQILIETLPEGIIQEVSDMMQSFEASDEETRKNLEQFFHDLIGKYNPGSTGGPSVGGGQIIGNFKNPPPGSKIDAATCGQAMLAAGFPAKAQILANGMETMEGESGFGSAPGWDQEHTGGVLGYWQIQLSTHGSVSSQCAMDLLCSTKAALQIWKAAGNCFACQPGPNPWQGGTDHSTKYLNLAERVIKDAKSSSNNRNQNRRPQ